MKFKYQTKALMTLGLAGLLLMTGCAAPGPSTTPEEVPEGNTPVVEIDFGAWVTGPPPVVGMWTHFLSEMPEVQKKHGIKFNLVLYSNLQAMYTDLTQGRVQASSGAPASAAAQSIQGAPIHIVGSLARSTAAILSTGKGWTASELKGARLVAPTGTGTWATVKGQIEDMFGLQAEKDYTLLNSQDLAGAATQLAAGTADYAMTWGETIPNALASFKNVKVVADPSDLAGPGQSPVWQFTISAHDSVSKAGADGLIAAIKEVVEWMKVNPEKVEAWGVSQGQNAGVSLAMIEGIQSWDVQRMNSDLEAELNGEFEKLIALGNMEKLPPASLYER